MWDLIGTIIKISIVVGVTQGTVAYLILVERKIAAFTQDRLGPNRVGREFGLPFGLMQPLADGAKMILKEDVIPGYVVKPLYILAPAIAIIMATIGFAVVPFGAVGETGVYLPGPLVSLLNFFWNEPGYVGGPIQFQIAPGIDIGILYVLAIGSLAVYGVILAGWSSNNKYAFLGGLRSSAQIISYEIPMGMSILGMVLLASSLDLNTIVDWQTNHGIYVMGYQLLPAWGVFVQPLGFVLFLVSAFAETNRLPFDLPESEQELVAGFHTEYSAMKFGMFFLGEYLHVITVSFITAILFFGGWDIPFVNDQGMHTGLGAWIWAFVKLGSLATKVAVMIMFIMFIRWTLPRFRYDQLMDLAWKSMIPLAILNLAFTAGVVQLMRSYWY